jgi:hypothetical protein
MTDARLEEIEKHLINWGTFPKSESWELLAALKSDRGKLKRISLLVDEGLRTTQSWEGSLQYKGGFYEAMKQIKAELEKT